MSRLRWASALAVAVLSLSLQGCEKEGCLGGEASCRVAEPCQKLQFSCADKSVGLKVLDQIDISQHGWNSLGRAGDIQLTNGNAVAVIAKLGNQNYLDPKGGSLLDLYVPGKDNDAINQVLTVVGVLPCDSAH